jgi:hypothetical protein
MEAEELKSKIRSNLKLENVNPPITGGQSCGVFHSNIRLISEELDLTITCGHFKSNKKNRDFLLLLFELVIDELIC